MASYRTPIYQSLFNPDNFNQSVFFDYTRIVFDNLANVFTSINTFMSDVLINGTLYVHNIQIVDTFLGYNISFFQNITAPIQQQFDSITTGGNVVINSTVSVGQTITLDSSQPARVNNSGTSTNAILNFEIPQGLGGLNAVQPNFSIGTVTSSSTSTPSVTLTGSNIDPVLNFNLKNGIDGINAVQPNFSIGTVTSSSSSSPSVTLTGSNIDPVLNFNLKNGTNGIDGINAVQPNFSIGTVTSSSSSSPSVTLTGSVIDPVLNFNLKNGSDGITPIFSIGDVNTSDSYSFVSISNADLSNPVLNFTLQKGDKGDKGDRGDKGDAGSNGRNGNDGKDADTTALIALTATAVGAAGASGTAATASGVSATASATSATASGISATAAREAADEVNARLYYFEANAVTNTQKCKATLDIINPAYETIVKLSNSEQSEFRRNVQFDENVILRGNITNYQDNSLNIQSINGDINITANNNDNDIILTTNVLLE